MEVAEAGKENGAMDLEWVCVCETQRMGSDREQQGIYILKAAAVVAVEKPLPLSSTHLVIESPFW